MVDCQLFCLCKIAIKRFQILLSRIIEASVKVEPKSAHLVHHHQSVALNVIGNLNLRYIFLFQGYGLILYLQHVDNS